MSISMSAVIVADIETRSRLHVANALTYSSASRQEGLHADCVDERAGQGQDDTSHPQYYGKGTPLASFQMAVAPAAGMSISGLWVPERVALKEDDCTAGAQLLAMLQALGKQLATAALLALMLGLQATAIIMPPAAWSQELVAVVWCAPGPHQL